MTKTRPWRTSTTALLIAFLVREHVHSLLDHGDEIPICSWTYRSFLGRMVRSSEHVIRDGVVDTVIGGEIDGNNHLPLLLPCFDMGHAQVAVTHYHHC